MIVVPPGVRVFLAAGRTDMRKGMHGLSLLVQETLKYDPFAGHLFAFRGRRGDLVKILAWDGQGFCLFCKRLEHGRFVWPSAADGVVALSPAQLSMLVEGIDWRMPKPHMASRGSWLKRRGCSVTRRNAWVWRGGRV